MPTLQGSCLCGRVRYQYHGELSYLSMCHCHQCQKAQGTAFVAVTPVQRDAFELLAGAAELREFRATPDKARVFCGHCGSPLYSYKDSLPDVIRLRLGTLDTAVQFTERFHQHVASQASWFDLHDDLPQFPGAARR
jgi:hypothetical protein